MNAAERSHGRFHNPNSRGQFFILAAVMIGLLIYMTKPPATAMVVKEGDPVGEFVDNAVEEYARAVDYSLSSPGLVKENLYSFSDFLANRSRDRFWTFRSFYIVDYSTAHNSTVIYGNFLGAASGLSISGVYYPVGDRSSAAVSLSRAPVAVSYGENNFVFYPNRTVSAYFYLEVCSGEFCQTRERFA